MQQTLNILFPWDGDFVSSRDGMLKDGILWIPVSVSVSAVVNGIPTRYDAAKDCHIAWIPLYGYRNTVTICAAEEKISIKVFVIAEENLKKFRISSDDNIRFLQELTLGHYDSIFDHPYLAAYKKAHDLYGAVVHLNLFYAFDDQARSLFSDHPPYFDLSMMTDRYKAEFQENAHWLKLAFHSRSEFPDKPYLHAPAQTLREDCLAVCREICRFAGRECLSDATTVHWGEVTREGIRTLRALGLRSLAGFFELDETGNPMVSYHVDTNTVRHVGGRDFWMDTAEDMIFARVDRILNLGSLEENRSAVQAVAEDPHRGGFVSLLIHEQYFYKDYVNYLADFEARILMACHLLQERGYQGSSISDVVKEGHFREYPGLI